MQTALFRCRGIVRVVVPLRRLVEQRHGCNGAVRRRRGAALLTLGHIGPVPRCADSKGDERFESAFLQRRVLCEPEFSRDRSSGPIDGVGDFTAGVGISEG